MNVPAKEEQEDIYSGYPIDIPLIDPDYRKIAKLGWRVRLACYNKLLEVLGKFSFVLSLVLTD